MENLSRRTLLRSSAALAAGAIHWRLTASALFAASKATSQSAPSLNFPTAPRERTRCCG
jgi:hypothetical protein